MTGIKSKKGLLQRLSFVVQLHYTDDTTTLICSGLLVLLKNKGLGALGNQEFFKIFQGQKFGSNFLLYLELLKPWAAYFDTASPKIRGKAGAYISSSK